MDFITAELITFLVTLLGGMIFGAAFMGCVLIYQVEKHHKHLEALGKERTKQRKQYQNTLYQISVENNRRKL